MPKISIITPVYIDTNEKVDWLDEMIQSVISQTFSDWELILIDDKSPLLVDTIKGKYNGDTRLRWLDNASNFGPAATRNTAVALAESECILPLDSDDTLANSEVLEYMHDAWIVDKTKTVYGNVQLLTPSENGFKRGKIFELASYTFENAMNLQGTMPVTAMHSKDAHHKAGGWKVALDQGREDVEYWIATGRACFCGLKINHTTLLYRKHEESRDYRLKINNQVEVMQQKIKAMHNDIYTRKVIVACCDKTTTNVPSGQNLDPMAMSQATQNQEIRIVTDLESQGYNPKDLEWVAYRGAKMGRSGSILPKTGRNLPIEYPVLGKGHVFQIHKQHKSLFVARQRLGFQVNQPDPREQTQPVEPEPVLQPEPQIVEVPKPQLSTLIRLDNVASKTREAEIVGPTIEETIIEPNAPQSVSSFIRNPAVIISEDDPRTIEQDFIDNPQMPTDHLIKASWSIKQLGLSPSLTATLNEAGYTVEKLATTEKLTGLKGVGPKRGKMIIDKAKELINNQ